MIRRPSPTGWAIGVMALLLIALMKAITGQLQGARERGRLGAIAGGYRERRTSGRSTYGTRIDRQVAAIPAGRTRDCYVGKHLSRYSLVVGLRSASRLARNTEVKV